MPTPRRPPRKRAPREPEGRDQVRYAVVGLGYFAQAAVLPAFRNAPNSELVALVSGDTAKQRRLKKQYGAELAVGYEEYDDLLRSGAVDAVYLTLPNSLHRDYTVRAARAGRHVLCEKPMAVTERDCETMLQACDDAGVKLMIGYRLHFEPANLQALELVRTGRLGDVRAFASTFTMPVRVGNIRLQPRELGGGPLYDIGVYCVNAARALFGAEPREVFARTERHPDDPRFREVEELVSCVLRFPDHRIATFTASFGAYANSMYDVYGTAGMLRVEPAYSFGQDLGYRLRIGEQERVRTFAKHDQVAPELRHFSECILEDRVPEPSGIEGLADVRIIRALYRSADTSRAVEVAPVVRRRRARREQEMRIPAPRKPELYRAAGPKEHKT